MEKKTPKLVLRDKETLGEVIDCLTEHLEIPMQGQCNQKTLFEILVHAASEGSSIEQTCKSLEDVPKGNATRYHLDKLEDMESLEQSLNEALHSRLPSRIRGGKQKVAMDLNLLPYYGKPSEEEAPYIYHSQAKAGTCSFYAYATVYVIAKGKRVTIALHAVRRDETMVCIITRLLDRIADLNLTIKRLYLDRGFFSVPVIRWLHACDIPFVMPVIIRGKEHGTRRLLRCGRSYKTHYTMVSNHYGSVSFEVWVVGTYCQGKYGRHGVEYQAYAVFKVSLRLRGLPDDYGKRFGIETSYRLKNHSRIRTTTKNPVVRLPYVGIAFLLVDLWVYLLWTVVSRPRKGARLLYVSFFTFKTMLRFLRQAIDRKHIVTKAVYLRE
jgi:hypothetical protein